MNKQIIIGIIAAVVILGGVIAYASTDNNTNVQESMDATNTNTNESMQKDDMQGDAMMEGEAMQKSGNYKDYSVATVEAEQKAGNKVVLFFHAPWCPECKKANAAFLATPEKIPAGVTVLKIDYDSNTELRKKYAVTYQHTFVQVDSNENLITKWNSGDIDMLIKSIK